MWPWGLTQGSSPALTGWPSQAEATTEARGQPLRPSRGCSHREPALHAKGGGAPVPGVSAPHLLQNAELSTCLA